MCQLAGRIRIMKWYEKLMGMWEEIVWASMAKVSVLMGFS